MSADKTSVVWVRHGRQNGRLVVLLAILAAVLVGGVLSRIGSSRAGGSDQPLNPPLTAAESSAAAAALHGITPPPGFHRYLSYNLRHSSTKPPATVPCLPEPSICFTSEEVALPLTTSSAEALLARFGVHARLFDCTPRELQRVLSTCQGGGSFSKYGVGLIVEVTRHTFRDLRWGTRVIIFAVRMGPLRI